MKGVLSWLANLGPKITAHRKIAPAIAPTVSAVTPDVEEQRALCGALDRGKVAYGAQDYATAARYLVSAIELEHDNAEAHHTLGLVYFAQNEVEDATDCFVMAVHFRPDFAEGHYHLGLIAQRRGDHREAGSCFERAIAARPGFGEAHNALGASVYALGNYLEAATHFEKAVELMPRNAHANSNLGYVLFRELGEYERGAFHLRVALELDPGDAGIRCNFNSVLLHEGRLEEAVSVCDRLLSEQPDLHEARLNRAIASLKLGRFDRGWADYEARKLVRSNYIPRPFEFPEWCGQALAGKTILVHAEQGLGDEIMFASCVPDLLASGGRCILECSPALTGLFALSFSGAAVHAGTQSDRDPDWLARYDCIDFQSAIGSLPRHFRRQMADFPARDGYLFADPARIDYWRERLNALGSGLRIGLAWRGGMASTRRALRSMDLEMLLPVLRIENCAFMSLQYGDVSAEIAALARGHGCVIHEWPEAIDDYDECAALVGALDLVISVQTSIVHLAGALGKPVWAMLPAVSEWRYLEAGDTMPWYRSARLLRQRQGDDWQPVVARVAHDLAQYPGR